MVFSLHLRSELRLDAVAIFSLSENMLQCLLTDCWAACRRLFKNELRHWVLSWAWERRVGDSMKSAATTGVDYSPYFVRMEANMSLQAYAGCYQGQWAAHSNSVGLNWLVFARCFEMVAGCLPSGCTSQGSSFGTGYTVTDWSLETQSNCGNRIEASETWWSW